MRTTAVRKLRFDTGHRVLGHEGKCANAHGHGFVAWIYAESDGLDKVGRVIDFSVLKDIVGGWIDKNWDHTFLIYEKDTQLMAVKDSLSVNKPVYICGFNPTAENLANYLLNSICPILLDGTGVKVTKVQLFETENCYAEVSKYTRDE